MADNGKNGHPDGCRDRRPAWGPWDNILQDEESDLPCPPVEEPPARLVLLTLLGLYPHARLEVARSADLPRVKPLGRLARWLCTHWPRLVPKDRCLTEYEGRLFLVGRGRKVDSDPSGGYYSAPKALLTREAAMALRRRYVDLIDAALKDGDEARARRLVDEHRAEYQREIIACLRRIA